MTDYLIEYNLIYRTITAISIYPHIANDFLNQLFQIFTKHRMNRMKNKPWLFTTKC